ncbi:MAG TPA: hypothetical protein VG146_04955 [Verrucomicrobiae bacterium]|nr:hypothetical protein [Verrucomicrobiae bacterium]
MNDLEARKRALVVESELYRKTLALEFHNLTLHLESLRSKLSPVRAMRSLLPLLPLAGAWLGSQWFGQRRANRAAQSRSGFQRGIGLAVMAWRVYRQVAPVLAMVLSRRRRKKSESDSADGSIPAEFTQYRKERD